MARFLTNGSTVLKCFFIRTKYEGFDCAPLSLTNLTRLKARVNIHGVTKSALVSSRLGVVPSL